MIHTYTHIVVSLSGLYHFGVLKALFEHRLLPRVISGSSVGSIAAALVATRTDEELPDLFDMRNLNFDAFEPSGSIRRKLHRLLTKGMERNHLPTFVD
jgi:TAG lipase/lysophosphatidylethanolamine acyltransferase